MTASNGMRGMVLGLLAETALHPGAGQSEGAIDLPVAREKTTGYPFVPGSGVKGAMRDHLWRMARAEHNATDASAENEKKCQALFGTAEAAGKVILSDAMLLLLPVRTLGKAYRWVTCPYLLERYARHRQLAGLPNVQPPKAGAKLKPAGDGLPKALVQAGQGRLFLEERVFDLVADPAVVSDIVTLVQPLIGHAAAQARLPDYLAVVADDEMGELARRALPVDAHNKLDANKVSQALWYEETIASDTLLYALAVERTAGRLCCVKALFPEDAPYLQLGGNETTGQGWLRVAIVDGTAP